MLRIRRAEQCHEKNDKVLQLYADADLDQYPGRTNT
jgi:hypothetical protein